jgi:serine/threonine-protein kinase RsbW
MGKSFSDQTMSSNQAPASGARDPQVFVVSSDAKYLESVLSQCQDVPETQTAFHGIYALMEALSNAEKLNLVFAIVVERTAGSVDALALRQCKLDYPQVNFIVLIEECEQRCYVRFQSLGVQSVLLPPFSEVNLKREIATALPNVPQFKRHPDLSHRGSARLDFLIPSDLSYVIGVNHLVSMLLREFSFPAPDYRINIPLACDEAITNAIIHGNGSDPEKKVSIQIYISASRIKIRIKDQGEGFDAAAVADPTEGANLLRPSGRGVYLMRSIMDTVEYKESGRVLELEKTNTSANGRPPKENNSNRTNGR